MMCLLNSKSGKSSLRNVSGIFVRSVSSPTETSESIATARASNFSRAVMDQCLSFRAWSGISFSISFEIGAYRSASRFTYSVSAQGAREKLGQCGEGVAGAAFGREGFRDGFPVVAAPAAVDGGYEWDDRSTG